MRACAGIGSREDVALCCTIRPAMHYGAIDSGRAQREEAAERDAGAMPRPGPPAAARGRGGSARGAGQGREEPHV